MEFFCILDALKEEHKNNSVVRENGTILLSPGQIPRAEHMLFKPLTDELIDEFLISQYKYSFPREYISFLKYSNGANLCMVRLLHFIKKKRKVECIPAASGLFTIYGLPRTQPFGRPTDQEEPFDLRIEDLARHDDIPEYWLKCGSYTRNYDFHKTYDIFIDTQVGNVYSCIKNDNKIVENWKNLDECFCAIYNSFNDRKEEYEFI